MNYAKAARKASKVLDFLWSRAGEDGGLLQWYFDHTEGAWWKLICHLRDAELCHLAYEVDDFIESPDKTVRQARKLIANLSSELGVFAVLRHVGLEPVRSSEEIQSKLLDLGAWLVRVALNNNAAELSVMWGVDFFALSMTDAMSVLCGYLQKIARLKKNRYADPVPMRIRLAAFGALVSLYGAPEFVLCHGRYILEKLIREDCCENEGLLDVTRELLAGRMEIEYAEIAKKIEAALKDTIPEADPKDLAHERLMREMRGEREPASPSADAKMIDAAPDRVDLGDEDTVLLDGKSFNFDDGKQTPQVVRLSNVVGRLFGRLLVGNEEEPDPVTVSKLSKALRHHGLSILMKPCRLSPMITATERFRNRVAEISKNGSELSKPIKKPTELALSK